MMTYSSDSDKTTIKFLYSYGGRVLPRRSDGQLRYVGGFTRVLAVDRSVTFAGELANSLPPQYYNHSFIHLVIKLINRLIVLTELMVKFGELCGNSMNLKCKLPNEDLDLLVTITCDEELASVIEEYRRVSISSNKEMKIRTILFPHPSLKKISPPSSPASYIGYSPNKPPVYPLRTTIPIPVHHTPVYMPAVGIPVGVERAAVGVKVQPRQWYSVRRWNQWL